MKNVVNLTWATHGRDLTAGLWKFFTSNYKADFDISINGSYIKAGHQLILGVFSPVVEKSQNNKLILGEDSNIEDKDVECLIEFLYRGEMDVNEERLPAIKLVAEKMGIKALADMIAKFIRESSCEDKKRTKLRQVAKRSVPAPANEQVTKKDQEKAGNKSEDAALSEEDEVDDETALKPAIDWTGPGISQDSFDPGSLEYKCKHCEAGFSAATDFYNHVKLHENRRLKYHCGRCEYKTEHSTRLLHHTMSRHGIGKDGLPLEKNLKCPHCPYVCAANFRLKNHVYQVHEGKTKVCDVCGYRCSSFAVLNQHKNLAHSDVRPYMCESCGYRAKSFQAFRNHMRTHLGQKVSCDVCGVRVSFTQLSAHKRIHLSGPKPHPCHLCSFAALRKCSLKIHLKNVHKYNGEQVEEVTAQNLHVDNKLATQFLVDQVESMFK